jgi:hypothetical protein
VYPTHRGLRSWSCEGYNHTDQEEQGNSDDCVTRRQGSADESHRSKVLENKNPEYGHQEYVEVSIEQSPPRVLARKERRQIQDDSISLESRSVKCIKQPEQTYIDEYRQYICAAPAARACPQRLDTQDTNQTKGPQ